MLSLITTDRTGADIARAHRTAAATRVAHALLLVTVTLLVAARAAVAEVRVADFSGAGSSACTGNCRTSCHCATLQAALDAAGDGDEVWVLPPTSGATIPCEAAHTSRAISLGPHPDAAAAVVFDCGGSSRALVLDARSRGLPMPQVTISGVTFRRGKGDSGGCVRADDVLLTVERCTFVQCEAEGTTDLQGGGVLSMQLHASVHGAALAVRNCNFHACRSTRVGGAVLFIADGSVPNGTLSLHHVAFRGCEAGTNGGAVSVYLHAQGSGDCLIDVANCRITHGRAHFAGSGLYVYAGADDLPRAAVRVADSSFEDNTAQFHGAVYALIMSDGSPGVSVLVTGSRFLRNTATVARPALSVTFATDHSPDVSLLVRDSEFVNNSADSPSSAGSAVTVNLASDDAPRTTVTIADCMFEGNWAVMEGGSVQLQSLDGRARSPDTAFVLSRCAFRRSMAGRSGGGLAVTFRDIDSPGARVAISDCSFEDCSAEHGGGAYIAFSSATSPGAIADIQRSKFTNCSADGDGGAVAVSLSDGEEHSGVRVHSSHFRACSAQRAGGALSLQAAIPTCSVNVTDTTFHATSAGVQGGAAFLALAREPMPVRVLQCKHDRAPSSRVWLQTSRAHFLRCDFQRVTAVGARGMGGAVAVAGGELWMQDCNVTDAHAGFAGGVVHSGDSAGVHLLRVQAHGAAAQQNAAVHHDGVGALRVQDSELRAMEATAADGSVLAARAAASAPAFDGSTLECVPGSVLVDPVRGTVSDVTVTEAWPVVAVIPCGAVSSGFADMRVFSRELRCMPCPAGTYFLGAGRMHDSNISAGECAACPFGAVCWGRDNVTALPGMWAAARERAGMLTLPPALVRCATGYCCAGDTTCRRFDSCAPTRTGVLCGDCEAGMTGVLGSARCRAAAECGRAWQDALFWPGSALLALAFALWQVRQAAHTVRDQRLGGKGVTAAGVTKAAFAYYQSLPLLIVTGASPTALQHATGTLQELFNFQLPTSSAGSGGGGGTGVCPFQGLTPVSMEMVSIALAAAVLVALPMARLAHAALAWFVPAMQLRCCGRRWRLHLRPPQAHLYAAAFTSLVMLTYATLTTAAMKLVTCVQVPGLGSRLLVQGSVQCWRAEAWWQWAALAWLVCSSLLVPAALAWGGSLLRRGAIAPRVFWLSLLLPLPYMLWWAVRHWRRGEREVEEEGPEGAAALGASTRLSLEATYRPAMWWWDSVLLLRRLLLALLAQVPLLLGQQPVMQALAGSLVTLVCLVAHVHCRPFASRAANATETCFLAALALAAMLSVRAATLLTAATVDNAAWRNQLASGMLFVLIVAFPAAWLAHRSLRVLQAAAAAARAAKMRSRRRAGDRRAVSGGVAMSANALRQHLLG